MNIFEFLHERYKLPKKPKLFEAFSGIGCQLMAFKRLGIEVESIGFSEIDKYAIQSYIAMHSVVKNYGSITDIKGSNLPQIDVFTYSFPCTDLSKAGKQKGLNQTRSGLVYEVLRILHETDKLERLPKVLIMENVVDLVQSKFIRQFQEIQVELEQLGYTNYTQTLNAKDYGVAQNRDRVFMVSILGDYYYEFPPTKKLEKRLKDYLETEVDKKYYLSDQMLKYCTDMTDRNGFVRGERFNPQTKDAIYAFTITTNPGSRPVDNFIKINEATEQGYAVAYEGDSINLEHPNSKTRRGRVGRQVSHTLTTATQIGVVEPVICASRGRNPINPKSRESGLTTEQMIEVNESGLSNTLTTVQKDNMVLEQSLRIRKLTPLECWRLMGIDDDDFHKAKASGVSNSQLYKQAGNGIVVDVFAEILRMMV